MPDLELPARAVVTPGGLLVDHAVVVDAGVIVAVEPASGRADDVILVPGYVDLQVNGIDLVPVWEADGDDWAALDAGLLACGTTTWCPTLVTAPLDRYDDALGRVRAAAARPADGRPHMAGVHLEGPFLGGRPGAHPVDLVIEPDADWLMARCDGIAIVTLAPESEQALGLIAALAAAGVVVAIGHTDASTDAVHRAVEAGARAATHLFNGMGSFHHRSPSTAGAVLVEDRLVATLIADGRHVDLLAVDLAFRAKPPGRVALVSDAVAWRSESRLGELRLTDGGAAVREDGTLAGATTGLDLAVANVVRGTSQDLVAAVRAAATTPADLLGLADRGRIEVGARADLVALDPASLLCDRVWIGGERVR